MSRRAVGFVAGLALAVALLTWFASARLDLPLRDPDSLAGPAYIRLPAVLVLFYLLDVIPRTVYANRGFHGFRATFVEYTKKRWTRSRLILAAVGLAGFYTVYLSYRNLKNFLPWVRPHLNDQLLQALDRALLFGHDPPVLLHAVLGTGVAAHVLAVVYTFFLGFVPLSLGAALVWSKNVQTGFWYVTALCINWALGAASYFWIPAVGSFYSKPEWFSDLPDTGVSQLQETLIVGRADVASDPYTAESLQSIAAFASLHVSIVLTAALICHLVLPSRGVRWTMWTYFVLTTIATIYFGWHYLLDDIAGVAMGYFAVWLAAKMTGHSMLPDRRRGGPDDGVIGTFPPATERPAADPRITPAD